MKVIATKNGFHGGSQKRPGDVFDVEDDIGDSSWFKPVNARPKKDEDLTKLPEPKGRTDEQKQVDADQHMQAEARRINDRASDSPTDLTVDEFKAIAKGVKAEEKATHKPAQTLSEMGKESPKSPLDDTKQAPAKKS